MHAIYVYDSRDPSPRGSSNASSDKSREEYRCKEALVARSLALCPDWLLFYALRSAPAEASSNKIALIPGGPHPYFAPWEQAAADAKKDFGIASVDYKVPTEWKLNLQTELIESLMTQGYNAFGIFPGDAVGINSTIEELAVEQRAARRARGLRARSDQGRLLPRHRRLSTPPILARRR